MPAKLETGADNETRTRDLFLGKEALYQLSYIRKPGDPKRIRTAVNREKAGCPSPLDDGAVNLHFTACQTVLNTGAYNRIRTGDLWRDRPAL